MRTVTVEVTQDDIDAGRRKSCFGCPVARALRRAVGGDAWVVGPSWARALADAAALPLPPEAARFVRSFDDRSPVSPFTFTLELPE